MSEEGSENGESKEAENKPVVMFTQIIALTKHAQDKIEEFMLQTHARISEPTSGFNNHSRNQMMTDEVLEAIADMLGFNPNYEDFEEEMRRTHFEAFLAR